ncbi:MAG: TolC family protein [Deltaproteobacteria bacterium]|nr:TolC family protein [Deltaproteobacteria bacterium]
MIHLIVLAALAAPALAAAQEDAPAQVSPVPGEVADPNSASGASQLQNIAEDEAVRGLEPVDPSVYVDAFQTLVDPSGMTVDEVAETAVATAPQMEQRRASIRAAEATAEAQWLDYLPQVTGSFGYTRLSEVEQPSFGGSVIDPGIIDAINMRIMDQRDGSALGAASADVDDAFMSAVLASSGNSFSFPQVLDQWALRGALSYPVTDLFLTIMPRYHAFEGFADAERLQMDSDRANVDLRAREAWYAHVRAQATLAVALAAQRQTEANRQQVEALVRAGVSPRVDLMRVEAQNASARVGVARSQGAVLVTAHVVRTLMHGEPGTGLIPVGENLAAGLPEVTESRAELVSQALDSRAEMLALRRLVGAREDLQSVQGGTRWPQIFIQAAIDYANPNQRVFPQTEQWNASWTVGAVVQYTLHQTLVGNETHARAEANTDQARADVLALRDAITIEVDQAYENFRASKTAIQAAGAGLQASEEAYRVRQEELAAGTAVARDLVDAEADLTNARINLVDSIIDLRVAHAQLRRAVSL